MKCCGKERDTVFCPHCGRSLSADLKSLLKYLEAQRNKIATRINRGTYLGGNGVAVTENHVVKWDNWIAKIKQIIERGD